MGGHARAATELCRQREARFVRLRVVLRGWYVSVVVMSATEPNPKDFSGSGFNVEEAERLAAQIRPAWEVDGVGAPAESSEAGALGGVAVPDTIIDGVPTLDVGDVAAQPDATPPIPLARAAAEAEPAPPASKKPKAPPPRPQKTRMGLGEGDETPSPKSSRRSEPPGSRRKAGADAPLAPAEAAPARITEDREPVEIPTTGASGLVWKIVAGVAAAAVLVIVIKVVGGSDDKPKSDAQSGATTAATPKAPEPAATAAPEPAKTEAPKPAATPEPAKTEPPKSEPVAAKPEPAPKPEPAKPAATTPPSKPPASPSKPGSGKKPGSGGIIRETPF